MQGGGCKDVEYMTPALKHVTLTFQDHYNVNITCSNFLQDCLVLSPLIIPSPFSFFIQFLLS